ncbi:MAG: hypothetical protein P8K08_24520 [Fuerstiella sp.]|jgi:hypothetical protein|nr:hypothetical protein [Fuerstiella sp.]
MTGVHTFVLALLCAGGAGIAQDRQHVIVVIGAEGTAEYGQMFAEWSDQWKVAATAGDALFEIINGDDSLEQLQQKLSEVAGVDSTEPLWLVLIGHGTYDGRVARFNLRGADLSADSAAELLAESKRPVAVINCSSCSAPFINALSGDNRTVITGTKDGGEIQFARFGRYIADGIGNLEADIDRDGQTSLLEAWLFASRRTNEYYKSDGRLATEHSLLDDTGDSKGTRAEVFEGVRIKDSVKNKDALDGRLARRWHLVRSAAERSLSPDQRTVRDRLESELELLRERKSELAEKEYLRQLELILLPLAKLYEEAQSPSPGEVPENKQ